MTAPSGFYAWSDTLCGVYYGPGCVQTALPELLEKVSAKKALIVTGKSLFEKTVEDILNRVNASGGVFHDISQFSPIAGIRRGVALYKENTCDSIVAVGGGSPIDAAKAILYFAQQEQGGKKRPLIAIPTTLSAAEYTSGVGYTDEEGNKAMIASPGLAPAGIIIDAELSVFTPSRLWLSTGMRALDHAVETMYRVGVPVPVKHLGYAAIHDLFSYLPESKANPQAIEVRQKLLVAAWMSLWPMRMNINSPTGLSHTIGYKIGPTYGIPHGITSCLSLAPVVKLQADVASPEDKKWLAGSLFCINEPSTGSVEADIRKFSDCIQKLVLTLGLQTSLSEYEVPKADLTKIAERTLGTSEHPLYPQVVDILESIYTQK
ncbi:Dehydroquinate synthase-like protein [Fistulina hepatica ATCC 64428]|uniref:Dehydroquinate synthase-like protein n=1 Tax=Fistulina hepatica ATCC 64428 TaxID=1128425 RepID=A0A0D7AG97_9AGAR|nr:Dehydroquinate synthase-like protein [Fistulina hepatica ATCC 64428]